MEKIQDFMLTQYTGTKTIQACAMTRVQAEEVLHRQIAEKSTEDEPGYLVKYPDGYLSWSPKKAFEDAYMVSETYVDRMKIELKEVRDRYMKGRAFSMTPEFRQNVDCDSRTMLRNQLNTMEEYIYILCKRISYEESLLAPTSDK